MDMQKDLALVFDEARTAIVAALKTEGFGVLTEVDVQKTLKEKIGVDVRRYTILGACHPGLAHQALQMDLRVGLMMPCNVVLYEMDPTHTTVMAVDPTKSAEALENADLQHFAQTVQEKLQRVLATL